MGLQVGRIREVKGKWVERTREGGLMGFKDKRSWLNGLEG